MDDRIRLLIVDDEQPFREALGERLELRGFAVTTAASGADALALMTDDAFDLALVDLKMAGMDGQALLARLKEDHPDLEVIILTGHGSVRSAVVCTRLGAFGYLPKPYELDELLAVLRDAYAQRLRQRFVEREDEERQRLEELIEAAQYESPLGILRRMRRLDAGLPEDSP